jgi:hypothetical protein
MFRVQWVDRGDGEMGFDRIRNSLNTPSRGVRAIAVFVCRSPEKLRGLEKPDASTGRVQLAHPSHPRAPFGRIGSTDGISFAALSNLETLPHELNWLPNNCAHTQAAIMPDGMKDGGGNPPS